MKFSYSFCLLAVLASQLVSISRAFQVAPDIGRAHLTKVVCFSTEDEEASIEDSASATPPAPAVKCPNCDLCDGSGRITGGVGAVLDWWPLKAYRPCPNFVERGGVYQRSGQGLDELVFGREGTNDGNN